jgi:glycogen operon protein
MGYRLTGSSDLYGDDGRHPHASINFVTAHDGFTLRDLVSYAKKHNLENGEDNRDGWDDNLSDNCGVEGETDDPDVGALRARQQKNFLVTLLLSQGVPMITAGDEMGKTQGGNNNPYCRDEPVSWLDWDLDASREELLAFTRELIALRRRHPVFRRRSFFRGDRVNGSRWKDIAWFRLDGAEMTHDDWFSNDLVALGMLLSGDALGTFDDHGYPMVDDSFLVILSASEGAERFTVPDREWGDTWELELDTARWPTQTTVLDAGDRLVLAPRSSVVLRRVSPVRGSWRPSRVPPPSPSRP